jgi:hypothetical protein
MTIGVLLDHFVFRTGSEPQKAISTDNGFRGHGLQFLPGVKDGLNVLSMEFRSNRRAGHRVSELVQSQA